MRRRQYGEYIAILIAEHDGFGNPVAETRQASAVRIADFVGSCTTMSYTTFLVAKYRWNVGEIAMFDPPLRGASHAFRESRSRRLTMRGCSKRNVIIRSSPPSDNPGSVSSRSGSCSRRRSNKLIHGGPTTSRNTWAPVREASRGPFVSRLGGGFGSSPCEGCLDFSSHFRDPPASSRA